MFILHQYLLEFLNKHLNIIKNIYFFYKYYPGEKMNFTNEYFIGGVLCLLISIGSIIIGNRISAATVVSFTLFLFGIYKAMK